MKDLGKEVIAFIGVVFILVTGALVLSQMALSAPREAQPQIQKISDQYSFAARLIIDWSSPDPALWIIRFVIGICVVVAGGAGAYFYFNRNG